MDRALAEALSNPLRARIVDALVVSDASAKQLAASLRVELSSVVHHLAVLRECGCVKAAETKRHRAQVENVFELVPPPSAGYIAKERVPPSMRGYAAAVVLQEIAEEGNAAVEAGKLDAREDSHLGCLSVTLDQQGWQDVHEAMNHALRRVAAAFAKSTARLAESGGDGIQATVVLASFESAGKGWLTGGLGRR